MPALASLLKNSAARNRLIGGAAITGLTIAALQMCLTLAFLWAHDIFDSGFAIDHYLATVATITLVGALAFFAIALVAMRLPAVVVGWSASQRLSSDLPAPGRKLKIGDVVVRELRTMFDWVMRWWAVGAVLVSLWFLAKAAWDQEVVTFTLALLFLVVTGLIAIRWYVSDAVVSN